MSPEELRALVRIAKLDDIWAAFPDDVAAAARAAEAIGRAVAAPASLSDEPWPPIRPDDEPWPPMRPDDTA